MVAAIRSEYLAAFVGIRTLPSEIILDAVPGGSTTPLLTASDGSVLKRRRGR
jgi:hypothetical protein